MAGFAALAVHSPKFDGNIGGLIRAASCYDARLVVLEGSRTTLPGRVERTDPRASHKRIPLIWTDDLFKVMPHESVPVAIELIPTAISLSKFIHPESAYYIFGGEDKTLSKEILDRCAHIVYIPTNGPMNLAATANVVLYDRRMKEENV